MPKGVFYGPITNRKTQVEGFVVLPNGNKIKLKGVSNDPKYGLQLIEGYSAGYAVRIYPDGYMALYEFTLTSPSTMRLEEVCEVEIGNVKKRRRTK